MTRLANVLLVLAGAYTVAAIVGVVNPLTVWLAGILALIAGAIFEAEGEKPRERLGPAFTLESRQAERR